MKRFYKKYPIIGFFANYIQLWKDISYYLTLVLNIFIIGSFAVFNADGTTTATVYQRLHEYNFFRKIDWTQQETERLFLGLGITMTICSLFVVIFFLAKIAPLIIKRAWAQPALIERPKPGYTIRLINLLFKLFFILFSCLADFEVLYYLGYGVMAVVGTLIHPFFYSFHLSVILIRYPTLKNVVRSITEPKEQLILTLVLMLVLTYIYTLVAYLTVQDDFYVSHSVT
jgi:inositol 1,4,5-triphosphate receptor type 1/inositol 1,4,5-triphosphate receptor type 3